MKNMDIKITNDTIVGTCALDHTKIDSSDNTLKKVVAAGLLNLADTLDMTHVRL